MIISGVLQNAAAFVPVITLGALLGCVGGYVGLNPFLSVLFSGIGIMKASFVLKLPLLAGIGGFIVVFGFISACWFPAVLKGLPPTPS